MSDWNAGIIEEFRSNEGMVGGPFEGHPLLLLHATGRKSGQERINPLAYLRDGDRYAIFATMGGADVHPKWVHNLEANPDVEVEIGTERFKGRATVLWEGPERDRLYAEQAKRWSQFGDYEKKTERTIPVVVIERVD
ncbi:MAG: nitroreductase family deazaflavin-dependent oxidoreductase [Actinomycetota bacterium]|nr:nitroreductase family deazaflavin-dependent oxidoreductase [Actinomycetota bacterium]